MSNQTTKTLQAMARWQRAAADRFLIDNYPSEVDEIIDEYRKRAARMKREENDPLELS